MAVTEKIKAPEETPHYQRRKKKEKPAPEPPPEPEEKTEPKTWNELEERKA
jgi:hypothetical protein